MALFGVFIFLLSSVNALGLWKGADPVTVKLCDGLSTSIGNLSTFAYQRDVDLLNFKILKLRLDILDVCKPDFRVVFWRDIPSYMVKAATELAEDIDDFGIEINTYEPELQKEFELDPLCCFLNVLIAAWILIPIAFKWIAFISRLIFSILRGGIIGILWLGRWICRALLIFLRVLVRLPVLALGLFQFLNEKSFAFFGFLGRFILRRYRQYSARGQADMVQKAQEEFVSVESERKEIGIKGAAAGLETIKENHEVAVEEAPEFEIIPGFEEAEEKRQDLLGYDAKAEFSRMGLPGNDFRITSLNDKYEVVPTYPSCLIIPKDMTDLEIKASSQFRSKGRFIAVTWKSPNSFQVIARSSQPLNGLWGKFNREDSELVEYLAKITRKGNPNLGEKVVKICDARPYVNALGNAIAGKGFERQASYMSSEIVFAGIENIHVVRNSFHGICLLLQNLKPIHESEETKSLLSDRYGPILERLYENRGPATWIGHISMILTSACDLASWIQSGGSILVHCSDGWDRTAQLVSLAQLLVDPYFRTLRGFCVLIEKDWIRFGHQFSSRYGHSAGDHEMSPIMIQWLDSIFQIQRQFPQAFEFNAEMLCDIADALFSCEFGTFLSNTEREFLKISKRTSSLWNTLLANNKYLNPKFDPSITGVLLPKSSIRDLTLFLHYFKRWDPVASTLEFDENEILRTIS
jgi:hypothetical protein